MTVGESNGVYDFGIETTCPTKEKACQLAREAAKGYAEEYGFDEEDVRVEINEDKMNYLVIGADSSWWYEYKVEEVEIP